MASDRTSVVNKEVEEWVSAGIVRPVRYPTWISNPVLVKKSDGNAYKGYHQVQMAQENEEKIAFYTDQGTYCYTKMPFGLKNAGATYQRLVDTAFQSQIGRNLEAYVDDMVIKSNNEKVLIEDIVVTFDNLRRINMKLNPKKCSFGVEEGKFMGYMVTSEGIRANPKKTKAIADMQSPRTLKEMQSLSGKLAALKRFLSRSAEKSLPFFETLKDITKKNKDEYRWTEQAERAGNGGRKCRIASQNKGGTVSDKLRKQDFERSREELCFVRKIGPVIVAHVQEATKPDKDDMERWTLFTDEASNSKGYGAGLVLINPSGVEFTYALRLNFASTNNEEEYEALLAGLRMARKMKVRNIDASQINGSYVASRTSMIKYLATTKECIAEFETFTIQNIPRNLNQKADILSKLATHAFDYLTKKVLVEVLAERSTDQKEVGAIVEEEEDN
ncbi:reverse transcriptase domain-containing protein [Tanacetum coccineum]